MQSTFLIFGALCGALGVALGAFGAHALQTRLSPERQHTFETGVRYQMYHALALLLTAVLAGSGSDNSLTSLAGWLFFIGILLFPGSLYLLVLSERRWLGAIAPLGGLAFIAGWVCLFLAGL